MSPLSILEQSFRPYDAHSALQSDTGPLCGVYMLIDGDEIVYVGVSCDLVNEIRDKRGYMTLSDRAIWLPLPAGVLRCYAGALIRELRPACNWIPLDDRGHDAEILYGLGLRDELTTDDIAWQEVA